MTNNVKLFDTYVVLMIDILIWFGLHDNTMKTNNAKGASIVVAAGEIAAFIYIPAPALNDTEVFDIE